MSSTAQSQSQGSSTSPPPSLAPTRRSRPTSRARSGDQQRRSGAKRAAELRATRGVEATSARAATVLDTTAARLPAEGAPSTAMRRRIAPIVIATLIAILISAFALPPSSPRITSARIAPAPIVTSALRTTLPSAATSSHHATSPLAAAPVLTTPPLASTLPLAATSALTAATRPVILVHGWHGLEARGFACADGVLAYDQAGPPTGVSPRGDGEFGALADRIAAERPVYAARWSTSRARTQPLEEAGACLAAQIAQVRAQTGASAVDIVAHSMGGLVARAYVEGRSHAAPYRGDVARIITLGTPHTGVAPDTLVRLYALLNLANARNGFLPCNADPGTCQLARESMRAWNVAASPNEAVTQTHVAGARWTWTGWLLPGPDDGLITLPSAAAGGTALADIAAGHRVPEAHAAMFHSRYHYVNGARTLRCLAGLLSLGGAAACDAPDALGSISAGGPFGPGTTPSTAALTYTPLEVAEIEAGGAFEVTIPLDPAPAPSGGSGDPSDPAEPGAPPSPAHERATRIAAGWGPGGGAAELTLVDPTGRAWTRDTLAALDPNGAYTEVLRADGSGAAVITLSDAARGRWAARVALAGGAATGTIPVAVFATQYATVRLEIEAPVWDAATGRLLVSARLLGVDPAMADAQEVVATWHRPGARGALRVALHARGADGAGGVRYEGASRASSVVGWSQLDVRATGHGPDGAAYARQASTMVPGAKGAAWLPWAAR